MKMKALVIACAMAFASQAYAVGPTPLAASNYATKLFISGSSALQNTIGQIANSVFTVGTVSVFYDGTATATGASGKNYRAYAGTFKANFPAAPAAPVILAGTTGILYETAAGGSIVGVVPVAQATPVPRLDLSLDTNCTPQTAVDAITGGTLYSCVPTLSIAPDAGISDVEPALFTSLNVPAGGVAASPAVVAALTTQGSLAQPMGIIVTPSTAVTNLTKAQVTALMSSLSTDWSWVDAAYTPGPVVVCRRVAGSGTQAAINAAFFGFPCSSSQQIPAVAQVAANGGPGAGNYIVIENSSSGALASCMTAAQVGIAPGYTINITNGTIATGLADATHVVLSAGSRAIGLMGVDRQAGTVKNAGINGSSATVAIPEAYNFISINGVAPTVNNASTGAYDVVVNSAWNKRKGVVGTTQPLAGTALAFYEALIAQSGNKAILGTSKTPPVPGVLALADPIAFNFDPALNADGTLTNPAMRVSKANTCQPAVQVQ